MMKVYDHNTTKDVEEYLQQRRQETPPTYQLLEQQKKRLEDE